MNQALRKAIQEAEGLPDAEQEELAHALLTMVARKKINARLAASEARGGETPHDAFMTELRQRYGG